MNIIRKISVGDVLKDALHYQVGGFVMGRKKTISDIIFEDNFFNIYVSDEDDVKILWKRFAKNIVSHIEYETEFE